MLVAGRQNQQQQQGNYADRMSHRITGSYSTNLIKYSYLAVMKILILLTAILLNNNWTFSLGDASSMERDFTHGTEYFTYYSKVMSSNHSHAPIMPEFDDSAWQQVSLPHDWVVDLPYSKEASHSHGYKCVGWKYPQNSVGWYRKHIEIPAEDAGKQIWIEFEGIFRNSQVFCNGCYLGSEVSGYVSSVYDLSPYLNYGGDNVITVRCDASTEEGWYYEGAGIYRNVYLHKAGPVAIKPYSLKVNDGVPSYELKYADASVDPAKVRAEVRILDAGGKPVAKAEHRWSPSDPYLHTCEISLYYDGKLSARHSTKFGVRELEFHPQKGLLINGESVKLKGCNLHLDHAGVGVAVPDELWRYRLLQLKKYGFNAVRSSHNPASPAMLDICDELGLLVIDENRQMGINAEQFAQLRNMIDRDRNHPCIILWSIANEEWAMEHSPKGERIAQLMSEEVHRLDPSRPSTYGNAGGRTLVKGVDVFGYNYIVQNPVDEYRQKWPEKLAVGTEETSGCGTRGKYETVASEGWMTPLNRIDTLGRINVIEHGWKFYKAEPWRLGLFYWTGQDYRGEPNPMVWPATGSQFGILDYCCFPKDEAFYLQSVWTSEPMVHICGPYNGEVWVYSNCEKVSLYADGRSLGRKEMPEDGHLVWKVPASARDFSARGFVKGRRVAQDSWPERPVGTSISASKTALKADGQDV
ncbi:MAG: glycoside hydrolase family 2 protein, partial [Bacteroidales bacterium]|nr:glycoside hydrolase family 2 protein [Bacteroidales bacterium]